ncbi:MAG: hypothetical protein IPO72_19980 [Saprospiraceae bacterium]|nr:hypothetical protein [Candidatus Vicinibacter affinis]
MKRRVYCLFNYCASKGSLPTPSCGAHELQAQPTGGLLASNNRIGMLDHRTNIFQNASCTVS